MIFTSLLDCWRAQNNFWIPKRFKITSLKFGKSWNVLQASGSLGVFINTSKNILKLWRLSRICRNSKKYLATSRSLGVFVNTWTNILKFWRLSRTCRNSRKSVSIFRNSGSVCKYLEISWIARRSKITFLKSGKSWNVLQASGSLRVFVNAWKNILKVWVLSRNCRNTRKIASNFRKFWSVCKYL